MEIKKGFTLAEGATHTLPSKMIKYHFARGKTCNNNLKAAFTLAEVLITLGVIGVVAAITIPTLTKNYNKHVIETRLKQNYSLLQNAVSMAIAENGDITNWDNYEQFNDGSGYNSVTFFDKYIFKYLKVIKYEKNTKTLAELGYKTPIYFQDGQTIYKSLDNASTKYVLNNGSIVVGVGTSNKSVANMSIDLNGAKGPNTCGKDIFSYRMPLDGKHSFDFQNYTYTFDPELKQYTFTVLTRDELVTRCLDYTYSDVQYSCCAYLIKENGWKFPKDYPIKF